MLTSVVLRDGDRVRRVCEYAGGGEPNGFWPPGVDLSQAFAGHVFEDDDLISLVAVGADVPALAINVTDLRP